MRRLRRIEWHRDERGVALITALMVSMAVLTLSIAGVELSTHNLDQSSRDRKRVQAIDVAESGIDAFESILRVSTSVSVPCPQTVGAASDAGANLFGDLPTTPSAHYAVYATFFSAWPPTSTSVLTCAAVQGGIIPSAILIKSVGTAVQPNQGRPVTRTMESLVRITPTFGVLNLAIFSDTGLALTNQLTVNGHASNDADVYTNGDFTLNNNTSIGGSVLAQGNITIGQGIVKVDTWAGGNVGLSSGVSVSGNATAAGTLTGSPGSVSLNNSTVYGNAKAKGTITLSNNSVVKGTSTPSATGVSPPPQQALPHMCWPGCTGDTPANAFQLSFTSNDPNYNTTCLQPSGCIVYTERDYSGSGTSACTSARSDIANWFGATSGNYVVVINAACPLQWGNNTTVNLKGHLAIISFGGGANCGANANIHGAICSVNNVTFNSVGGTWNMILIRPWESGLNCSTGDYDITISNSTVLNGLKTFIYSQCVVNFGNNNASGVNSQLIGGTVNITNQMILNFDPILSPNVKITGYNLGPSYLREIANGT